MDLVLLFLYCNIVSDLINANSKEVWPPPGIFKEHSQPHRGENDKKREKAMK